MLMQPHAFGGDDNSDNGNYIIVMTMLVIMAIGTIVVEVTTMLLVDNAISGVYVDAGSLSVNNSGLQ